jgi:hypothetical protein
MDTTELSWRDKVAIVDVTTRVAVAMFLMIVAFCELLVVVRG